MKVKSNYYIGFNCRGKSVAAFCINEVSERKLKIIHLGIYDRERLFTFTNFYEVLYCIFEVSGFPAILKVSKNTYEKISNNQGLWELLTSQKVKIEVVTNDCLISKFNEGFSHLKKSKIMWQ